MSTTIIVRQSPVERVLLSINDACAKRGCSRSTMYRLLRSGDIQAVKSGRRTLPIAASVQANIDRLPKFGA